MIDFTNFKQGTPLNLTITDDEKKINILAKLGDIDFAPNRTPFLANLIIAESEDYSKFPKDSIMILEVNFQEDVEYRFLLKSPTPSQPARFFNRKAKIHLN
jgi:hypothetical protein